MFSREARDAQSALNWAWIFSLSLHALVLLLPHHEPKVEQRPPTLQARLAAPVEMQPVKPEPVQGKQGPAKGKPVLAMPKSNKNTQPAPRWTTAERNEMNRFLEDLGSTPKNAPTLAQRSLAMAREVARQDARRDEAENAVVERLPNSPPIDPFGLELYMEALIKKLNRSAAYVKNDPRAKGVKMAAVQVKLNPNGTLKSFKILNAGDQQDEIAFVRQVVEQAVPFAAFPADIQRSAKSLSMLICIMPPRAGGGGFGFTRHPDGRSC
jgi:hypothetical protein